MAYKNLLQRIKGLRFRCISLSENVLQPNTSGGLDGTEAARFKGDSGNLDNFSHAYIHSRLFNAPAIGCVSHIWVYVIDSGFKVLRG
jgi:hypothetical protein